MSTVLIRYDAFDGIPIPDGKVMDVAKSLIEPTDPGYDVANFDENTICYTTSSNLLISALRLLRKNGDLENLIVLSGNQVCLGSDDGRLTRYGRIGLEFDDILYQVV